jgi:hypothetical protein
MPLPNDDLQESAELEIDAEDQADGYGEGLPDFFTEGYYPDDDGKALFGKETGR